MSGENEAVFGGSVRMPNISLYGHTMRVLSFMAAVANHPITALILMQIQHVKLSYRPKPVKIDSDVTSLQTTGAELVQPFNTPFVR